MEKVSLRRNKYRIPVCCMEKCRPYNSGQKPLLAHTNQCHCVTVKEGVQSVCVVEDLQCDHEECDTRVFLHAQHAAREHKAVIIKSSDTDVAVIAVSVQTDLPCSLYVFTGTGNRTRIIDITKVSSANKI